jgi:hypothetical protein
MKQQNSYHDLNNHSTLPSYWFLLINQAITIFIKKLFKRQENYFPALKQKITVKMITEAIKQCEFLKRKDR